MPSAYFIGECLPSRIGLRALHARYLVHGTLLTAAVTAISVPPGFSWPSCTPLGDIVWPVCSSSLARCWFVITVAAYFLFMHSDRRRRRY